MDNSELIKKCLSGDRTAHKHLYDTYAGELYAISLRYARHELEAQDILQEAFIIIFDKLETLRNPSSLRFWMKRILIHEAIRNYRKASYQNEKIGLEDYEDDTVDAMAIHKMTRNEILDLIAKLPDGYQTVFNLYAIEGYKHKEIAAMLNIGESTSRSQLVKARKMLKTFLQNLHGIAI